MSNSVDSVELSQPSSATCYCCLLANMHSHRWWSWLSSQCQQ